MTARERERKGEKGREDRERMDDCRLWERERK